VQVPGLDRRHYRGLSICSVLAPLEAPREG
jgi:hypothetical protein